MVRKSVRTVISEGTVLVDGQMLPLVTEGARVIRPRKRLAFSADEDNILLHAYAISARVFGFGRSGFYIPIAKLLSKTKNFEGLGRVLVRRRMLILKKHPEYLVKIEKLVAQFKSLYDRAIITHELEAMHDLPGLCLYQFHLSSAAADLDYTQAISLFLSQEISNTSTEQAFWDIPDSVSELMAHFEVTSARKEPEDLFSCLETSASIRSRIAKLYSMPLNCNMEFSQTDQNPHEIDTKESVGIRLCEGAIKVCPFY